MSSFPRKANEGFTLIELLFVVAIIGILAMMAIPNLLSAQRKTRYARAAADTKIATTQAIVYANDRNVFPTSINAVHDAGLTNVSDADPWRNGYVLCPSLTAGLAPGYADDVYIYSKGASTTGTYPVPFVTNTGVGGSVGYSSAYGSWAGT